MTVRAGRKRDFRPVTEAFFRVLAGGATALLVLLFALVVGLVLYRGLPSLSLTMLTRTPRGGYYLGKKGGLLNAIVGSAYVATGATGLALLAALPVALYLRVYAHGAKRMATTVRLAMEILWGVPSIVYGAFGFILMTALGLRASLIAAIVTVSLFELPILVRAMDEVLRMVPQEIEAAAFSLGATRLETAVRVVLRQALPGLLTGALLAFGRGIGDTACVLLTAGFTDRVPTSLTQPVATLPLAIFFQLGTPFPEVQARAYAAATLLTALVLAVSLVSRALGRRLARHIVT